MKQTQYVLVDSFHGRLSDFADEEVYSVFKSCQSAAREVVRRFRLLASESPGQFDDCNENDILYKLLESGKCEVTSQDGCEYSWRISHAV